MIFKILYQVVNRANTLYLASLLHSLTSRDSLLKR